MNNYKHFLITRFNIIQAWYGKTDKNGKPTQTEKWLIERFYLFSKYCFPSVKNQSCTDFTWLVLFNSKTPDLYKQKIDDYKNQFDCFKPLFLEPFGDEKEIIRKAINESKEGACYVITSRLDNDDVLHKDFIKVIQNNFTGIENDIFISFVNGYAFDLKRRALYSLLRKNNHYVSRIEKYDNHKELNTVLCDHGRIAEYADIKYININPLWIEIIHEGNVGNSILSVDKPVYSFNKTFFNVDIQCNLWIFFKNIMKFYFMKLKCILESYIKKIKKKLRKML